MSADPPALKLPHVASTANASLEAALRQQLDHKAKPVGALGRLETLAIQVGLIQGHTAPYLEQPQLVVFAADHGLVDEGVSAFNPSATLQLVQNMMRGGSAANVLARQHGFDLTVVDAGVGTNIAELPEEQAPLPLRPQLLRRKIGFGTRNMARGQAMTGMQALSALSAGMDVIQHLPGNVVAFGDVGVGNTSSSALLLSRLCSVQLDDAVGKGSGLNDAQHDHKLRVLFEVSRRHRNAQTPLAVLSAMGGYELAMMCGAMIQAAAERRVILVDGFTCGAAALLAREFRPDVTDYMVFSHRSAEMGHRIMLIHLQAQPLLDLEMRLGQGTGALMAWPLVASAVHLMNQMATREAAGLGPLMANAHPADDLSTLV
jgi:nicotinate-nucleotide--dimethylbenzimidazole phosphoribosyltransferase